jgi:hypothetical protein
MGIKVVVKKIGGFCGNCGERSHCFSKVSDCIEVLEIGQRLITARVYATDLKQRVEITGIPKLM